MYGDRHYRFRYHVYDHCIFVVCTGTDITGIDTMYMTVVYLWYVRGQTLQVRYHLYKCCILVVCTGTDITGKDAMDITAFTAVYYWYVEGHT